MWFKGLLTILGLVCLIISAVWWVGFFQLTAQAAGIKIDAVLQKALPCLVYTTAPCQIAYTLAELSGNLAYRPFLTWTGAGLFMLGIFLPGSKRPPTPSPTRGRIEPRL